MSRQSSTPPVLNLQKLLMFNEYETQYWGCRYMYIEKQWHQSIECNCTQKGGKNQTTTPTFNWKWRRFLPLSPTVDTTTEEAGRVRRWTKIFWHLLVHRQIHQRFDFRSTHTKPTSRAATENATSYTMQHHKHPQPLQCWKTQVEQD